ncbi:MAG: B12-binding domain-containing radical SAM protein, partial [bacterium]|nr:B12-binding domain-containing radical SAM protein [bacterium]
FFEAYNALAAGKEPVKPEKTKFKEFVKTLHRQDKNRQKEYWQENLKGIETGMGLTIKRRNPSGKTRPGSITRNWGKALMKQLEVSARESKVTPAVVLYTAWGLLLQKYNNCEDAIFGTTLSGRSTKLKGIEEIVGLFINTLPLRVASRPKEKIPEILKRTENSTRTMQKHENTPLVKIKEYAFQGAEEVLFDTIVVIENYPLHNQLKETGGSLTLESHTIVEMTHYDITVGITLQDELTVNFI